MIRYIITDRYGVMRQVRSAAELKESDWDGGTVECERRQYGIIARHEIPEGKYNLENSK